jgi:hypothetical protein
VFSGNGTINDTHPVLRSIMSKSSAKPKRVKQLKFIFNVEQPLDIEIRRDKLQSRREKKGRC